MKHAIRLAGHGIRLEPLGVGHASALSVLLDDGMWAGMATPRPKDAHAFADFIDAVVRPESSLAFVVLDDSGTVRGMTTFYEYTPAQGRIEIGNTWYARDAWGGRTNPAAKLLLLQYAFEELGVNRVAFRCDTRNTRSAAAIQRLGAVPEGVLRSHRIDPTGAAADTAYFSIIRDEWPTVRAGLLARLQQ